MLSPYFTMCIPNLNLFPQLFKKSRQIKKAHAGDGVSTRGSSGGGSAEASTNQISSCWAAGGPREGC